jgi:8-oxo-dGTP diphosphatase
LEFNKEIEDCATIENKKETNISIKNIKIAGVTNDIFRNEKKHYITIHVMAEFSSGKLTLMEPDKWEKWDWFNWSNWPGPLFLPIQNLIKQKDFKI